ncbi:MAG: hypothetical protein ABIH48_01560 [Candidatus Falkowbacteria bacterium]
MEKQDLQQIKEVVKETVKEDIRGIVREEVKSVVKEELKKTDEKIDEVLRTTKMQFDDNIEQFKEIRDDLKDVKDELKKKPNKSEVLSWGDEEIIPVKLDVDKIKYIHRKEWKNLPNSGTVSRVLMQEGIKS